MNRLVRDIGFLIINTILMAIIAFSSVNNLRVVKEEIKENRAKTEIVNACQLEALKVPTNQRENMDGWIQSYTDCVSRRTEQLGE